MVITTLSTHGGNRGATGSSFAPPVEPLHNAVDTQAGFRIVNLAYAEQRPGDCAYYINGNGHQVPRAEGKQPFTLAGRELPIR